MKKGSEKYDWRLHELSPTVCLDLLSGSGESVGEELPFKSEMEVGVTGTVFFKMGLTQHIGYTCEAKDRNGATKFTRRYTEYIVLRNMLVKVWPGVILPTLPSKTLIGSSEDELIRSRSKYINHFWRGLGGWEQIYYS